MFEQLHSLAIPPLYPEREHKKPNSYWQLHIPGVAPIQYLWGVLPCDFSRMQELRNSVHLFCHVDLDKKTASAILEQYEVSSTEGLRIAGCRTLQGARYGWIRDPNSGFWKPVASIQIETVSQIKMRGTEGTQYEYSSLPERYLLDNGLPGTEALCEQWGNDPLQYLTAFENEVSAGRTEIIPFF